MATRLRDHWVNEQLAKMELVKNDTGLIKPVYSYTSSDTTIKRFIINALLKRSIPYRVIQHGAGITQITTETDLCPKCGGKGRC